MTAFLIIGVLVRIGDYPVFSTYTLWEAISSTTTNYCILFKLIEHHANTYFNFNYYILQKYTMI